LLLQPAFDPDLPAQPGNGIVGRIPEKIHARDEKKRIDNSGDQDPLPQFMFDDKIVCFIK
jgi:hypothetical protein